MKVINIEEWLKTDDIGQQPEYQRAQTSKITNDGLTRSGTGSCTHMATVGIKELNFDAIWERHGAAIFKKIVYIYILPFEYNART